MSSTGFQFKQFYVRHDQCAMKVGTDGVLIGAWAGEEHNDRRLKILDIGTGSGLVALMLAQRFEGAQIDAIDIDEAAVKQAQANAMHSAFSARIAVAQSALQSWHGGPYDLIVSNPPFFQNSLKNPDKGRELARHTDRLAYAELVVHSVRMLKDDGQIAYILPADAEQQMRSLAIDAGLACTRITHVYSKECKPARRVLMAFSRPPAVLREDKLVLEDAQGGRSAAYQAITKDFYL